jgi:small subunit ribosomal protein S19e
MTTVYDVPADKLIAKVVNLLKSEGKITPPEWSSFVKTGIHREKPPVDTDWWYTRTAAVLRKIYIKSPVGVKRVSQMFGGAVNRGMKPSRAWSGSKAIIRHTMKQLEDAGFIKTVEGKGRIIQPAGQKLLDNAAHEVRQEIVDELPEISKY